MNNGRHANVPDSTTGDCAQVASFFQVSERTLSNWYKASPPLITVWQLGHNICFGEEAIVELKVKKSTYARAMKPGEAQEIARNEWRAHLQLGRMDPLLAELADLRRRVEAMEKEAAAKPRLLINPWLRPSGLATVPFEETLDVFRRHDEVGKSRDLKFLREVIDWPDTEAIVRQLARRRLRKLEKNLAQMGHELEQAA